jgi:hypothetical protein
LTSVINNPDPDTTALILKIMKRLNEAADFGLCCDESIPTSGIFEERGQLVVVMEFERLWVWMIASYNDFGQRAEPNA